MADCDRCGLIITKHDKEYPCLCLKCADYMRGERYKRVEKAIHDNNDEIKVVE